VVASGLVPGKKYYYQVGTTAQTGDETEENVKVWSKEFTFIAPVLPGTEQPLSFIVYGTFK
jgi:hypothetical protein